jgi:hypothetical protein
LGSYRPSKIEYEVLVRLLCLALAGYICNMEMMQLRNKLGGRGAFSCRENLNQSTVFLDR